MAQKAIQSIEELRSLVGQEVGVSGWLSVDQRKINAFAEITDDHQWIHTDTERARTELPGGQTIAHGFLTLSLLSVLLRNVMKINVPFKHGVNYGFNRVRFPSPVPAGSQVRVRCKLLSVEEPADCLQLCWGVSIELKDATKPALVAEWLVRYYQ
jgi:acyl dehydratase